MPALRLGDVIQGALDDIEDIALDESGFVADGDHEIALGEVGHGRSEIEEVKIIPSGAGERNVLQEKA